MLSKPLPNMSIIRGRDFKSSSFLSELNQSLGTYLLNEIRKNENRICLIDSKTKEEVQISELVQQSLSLTAELQALGCGHDTIVGIISENRLEYLTVALATIFAGATLTCFNPAYTIAELQHTINISRPSIVFCSSKEANKIEDVNKSISCVQHFIYLDSKSSFMESDLLLFRNLIRSSKKYVLKDTSPDNTATILYSSGTTGLPKGVMLSHRNWIFILKMIHEEDMFNEGTNICFVPMYHVYGLALILKTLVQLSTTIIMQQFDAECYLKIIEEYRVNVLSVVPTVVRILNKSRILQNYDLSSVHSILCGAATLEKTLENELRRQTNVKRIQQAYGLTEAILCLTYQKDQRKPGSCGSPIPGVQIKNSERIIIHVASSGIKAEQPGIITGGIADAFSKVIDPETGQILGANEVGEICIKGPQVTKGYYKNEKATLELIDRDGWLHSGDAGYYDEENDFFIIDRFKDLIKYKEYQVPPAELEALLLKHEDVEDAAVIGIPDDMAGEIPKAFVVKRAQSKITEKELVNYVDGLVSPQKRLRGGVTFVGEIPKNQSGKILRRELRTTYVNVRSKY